MNRYQYHTAIIGGGAAGLTVAVGLARLGKKIALIERHKLGGECTHSGCVPSKALLHAVKTLPKKNVWPHVRRVVSEIWHEEQAMIAGLDQVTVIKAAASFVDGHTLALSRGAGSSSGNQDAGSAGQPAKLTARHVVIAAGSSPRTIDIPGLPASKDFTNQNIFTLKKQPQRLAIVGAGPIGIELAMAFAAFGTKVDVLHRGQGILSKEDPEVSQAVQRRMEQLGVTFHWHTAGLSYANGKLEFTADGQQRQLSGLPRHAGLTGVLQAIGRQPNVTGLELENACVEYDPRGLAVSNSFQTNVGHIYAIGDVLDDQKFTHLANAQGRVVVRSIGFPFLPIGQLPPVPRVTYTFPEIASVGMTRHEIDRYNPDLLKKITVPFAQLDRGRTDQTPADQRVIVYAQRLTGRILGATVYADHAGEMLPYFIVAINRKLSLWKLYPLIFPYPTLAQAFTKAADVFMADTLSNLKAEAWAFACHQSKSFIRRYGLKLLGVGLWLIGLWAARKYAYAQGYTLNELVAEIAQVMTSARLGPAVYVTAYFLRPIFLLPATLLTVLAGLTYGLGWGFVLAVIGSTLSTILPYALGRWFAHATDQDERARSRLKAYTRRLKNHPFTGVLLLRLLYMPFDLVSILAGNVRVNFWAFFGATAVGGAIGTLTLVSFGASVEGGLSGLAQGQSRLSPVGIAMSLGLVGLSLMISRHAPKFKLFKQKVAAMNNRH